MYFSPLRFFAQVGNGARRFRLVLGELCHLNQFLDDLFRGRVGERGGLGSCYILWRIIPVSNWLVTPIYKPWKAPFGRGITLLRGLTNHSHQPLTK